MVRIRSGIAVTGLVAAALATVAVLTAQASDAPPRQRPGTTATTTAERTALVRSRDALPVGSGSGERVVYGIGAGRVWLVGGRGQVVRAFRVTAGDVPPALGVHRVFARLERGPGGDGTQAEHVVLFASTGSANVGFGAAAGPHLPAAVIREQSADAAAMWRWATIGTIVEVAR